MATTYTLISSVTVGSGGAASISFTSIPQTYTDLKIVWSTRVTQTGVESAANYFSFNSSTANFSWKRLRGNGSAADSFGESSSTLFGTTVAASATASTFSNTELYIPNYTGNTNKSFSVDSITENNATTAIAVMFAGLWSDTAAITGISWTTDGNFVQYSTAYLYGISNA
jgi:hypothetical protein